MNCQHCKRSLGCGCQKRVANDGTSCCIYCVEGYNQKSGTKQQVVIPITREPHSPKEGIEAPEVVSIKQIYNNFNS